MSPHLSFQKVGLACEVVAKGIWKPHVFIQGSLPWTTQSRSVLMTCCVISEMGRCTCNKDSKLLLYANSCAVQCLHWGSLIFTCFISVKKGSNSKRASQKAKIYRIAGRGSLSSERPISGWFWNFASFKLLHMTYTLQTPFESNSLEIQHIFSNIYVSSDCKTVNPVCKLKCVVMLNICVWIIPPSLPLCYGMVSAQVLPEQKEVRQTDLGDFASFSCWEVGHCSVAFCF